jgi:hypothetical protein
MSRLSRIFLALILCGLMSLVTHSQAHATTLTPPPLPGAICQTTGSGIFCHGSFTFSYTNQDTGVSCGAFEVLTSYAGTETYQEHYNSSGLGLEATFHIVSPGTFINSATGKTITSSQYFTINADLAIPGDLSTQTTTLTGALNISTGATFGLVGHDVGKITFDPNGSLLFEAGPHNSFDNFPAFAQAICAALS